MRCSAAFLRCALAGVLMGLAGCSPSPTVAPYYQPPAGAVLFRLPDEEKPFYWARGAGPDGAPVLSVARDAGLYPGFPDSAIDLQCRADGTLSVGSQYVQVATDVGDRIKPQVSISGRGVVLSGPAGWRSTSYAFILEDLRLRPTPGQLRSLLSGELCLHKAYPDGSEGASCYPAPPAAMAQAFLADCAAKG